MNKTVASNTEASEYSYIHIIKTGSNTNMKIIPQKTYEECAWLLWSSYPTSSSSYICHASIFNRAGMITSLLDRSALSIAREDVISNAPNTTGNINVALGK